MPLPQLVHMFDATVLANVPDANIPIQTKDRMSRIKGFRWTWSQPCASPDRKLY
jgi:hypothetical protein